MLAARFADGSLLLAIVALIALEAARRLAEAAKADTLDPAAIDETLFVNLRQAFMLCSAFAKPLFAHGKFVPKRGVLNAIGPLKPPKPFQPLPPAKPLFQLFCEVAVPPQQSLESKPGQLVQVCVGDQPFGVVLYMRVTPLGALRASRNSRALAWRRDRALVRATLADH